MTGTKLLSVAEREFRTVFRTRALLWLSFAFALVVLGLVRAGSGTGYASIAASLLTPFEILVPVLALAFAYRSVLEDRRSGELAMLQTMQLDRSAYVLGVYCGRATAFLTVIVGTLLAAGVLAALSSGRPDTFLATHSAGDSVFLYLRFAVLTALFALVVLAAVVAVSALSGSVRAALALALLLVVALVVGLDLGLTAGLATGLIGDESLAWVLSASPNSAYRALVLELVVEPVGGAETTGISPVLSLAGLLAWFCGALAVGIRGVWSASD